MQGFRAGLTPESAAVLVRNSTVWLLLHQDKIERHRQAGVYLDDVAAVVWDLRKKFPRDGRGPDLCFRALAPSAATRRWVSSDTRSSCRTSPSRAPTAGSTATLPHS